MRSKPNGMDTAGGPVRAPSGVHAMLAMIERNIADGAWPPGAKLPTERTLEAQFGLARNTLRKALKELEAQGKITRHVGRGSFVALARSPTTQAAALIDRLRGASPSEVMEVRLMIEPVAAELAATRATMEDLRRIGDCLREAERAPDLLGFEHWDGMLHLAIVAAARNGLLETICASINEVRNQPEWTRLKRRSVTPERRLTYHRQHSAILAALSDRDTDEARRCMAEHLATVQANLLRPATDNPV